MTAYAKGQGNSGCGDVPDISAKVSLEYDALGRVKKTDFHDANTPDITKTYDDNGNVLTVNRATGGSAVNWTYAYNNANMLTHETLSLDGRSFALSYSYNSAGHLTQRKYPTGRAAVYALDGLGRTKGMTAWGRTYASNMNYHADGSLHQMTYGNGYYHSRILNNRLLTERLLSYKGCLLYTSPSPRDRG